MVKNIVQKSLSAFVSKQTNIFSAAFFIVLTTILSQLLGFLKYRLLVAIFGASSDLGVLFAAFRIPDLVFQIVIAGAISSSFIPIFTGIVSKGKKDDAYTFTSRLMSFGAVFYVIVTVFILIFAPILAKVVAPGFSENELQLMTGLIRIIQLAQVFFILGTIATATLQSLQHFLIPGIAASFYNFGIILGIIMFTSFFGIYGAAIGVMIGAALFFAVQIPLLKMNGFTFTLSLSPDDSIKKLFRLMIPRSLTLVLAQISMTANVFFASLISARSLVIFDLAQTLVIAPVLLFGQSIAQASFPALSIKSENKSEFIDIFTKSLNQILYFTLPISALLVVLRIPIVRLFYGASRFDWPATVDTGLTLAYFSLSLSAQALIYLFARGFYALKDTRTPFLITLVSVSGNVVLSALFISYYKLPIYFLALSFSAANIVSLLLLTIFMNKKISLPKSEIIISGSKIFIASLVTGVALYMPIKLLDQLVFDTTRTINLLALTSIASIAGLCAYIFLTWLLDIKEAFYVFEVVKRFDIRKKVLKNISETIEGTHLNP